MNCKIVILNWNGAKMLHQYLPSVISHSSGDAEIIVADNASSDNSVELLRSEFPSVKLVLLDKNYGFADGYNRAFRKIEDEYGPSDYYILLNSDVEVTENWVKPLISFMDSHPDAAACQPKLRAISNRSEFEYAGASGGFIDKYGYPFCRGRIFDTVETDKGQYDDVCEIFWATGACMVVRRSAYWEAGGLDGHFFAHNEEIDLCWRMKNMGLKVYCVPQSTVFHLGGGTLNKENPRKTYLNFRNNLTMLYKNLSDDDFSKVMRMRLILDYVAAFQMLILKRSWGNFKAIINARNDFSKWKGEFKRVPGKKDTVGLIDKSILWQYYVKGKKVFSDL